MDVTEGAAGSLKLQADVTDEAAVQEVYARARDELGRVDVLVQQRRDQPGGRRLRH